MLIQDYYFNTLTVHEAVFPLALLTVILAVPGAFAFISPFNTVATFESELVKVSVLSEAFDGATVVFS